MFPVDLLDLAIFYEIAGLDSGDVAHDSAKVHRL